MIPVVSGLIPGLPWKAIGWAAAVLAVAIAGWRVSAWRESHVALPGVQAALAAEVACEDGSECKAREARLQEAVGHETIRIVTGYEAELAGLRARPARVVRLCAEARPGDVRGAGPAAGPDGAGPAAGVIPGPAGADLGPELYRLARDADEVAARLRALQGWNQALSTQPNR